MTTPRRRTTQRTGVLRRKKRVVPQRDIRDMLAQPISLTVTGLYAAVILAAVYMALANNSQQFMNTVLTVASATFTALLVGIRLAPR